MSAAGTTVGIFLCLFVGRDFSCLSQPRWQSPGHHTERHTFFRWRLEGRCTENVTLNGSCSMLRYTIPMRRTRRHESALAHCHEHLAATSLPDAPAQEHSRYQRSLITQYITLTKSSLEHRFTKAIRCDFHARADFFVYVHFSLVGPRQVAQHLPWTSSSLLRW